jgi:aquaporin Z
MSYLSDNRLRAEFFGTLCLVLIGCSSMILTGFNIQLPMGFMAIGLSFGITFAVLFQILAPISGSHLNPAVTAAFWSAGRFSSADTIAYVVAQCLGAIAGSVILYLIAVGRHNGWDAATQGLGQTGWLTYGVTSAILAEFIGALLLAGVFLAATDTRSGIASAGLAIGMTLVVIHFAFIAVSGASVNPARSLGPGLFSGAKALSQLWLYLIVPTLGGLAAGWLAKSRAIVS